MILLNLVILELLLKLKILVLVIIKMRILKVLENTELVVADLEVNLGKEKRTGLTLCVKYKGEYYPLNTAHDGRPILMNKENVIKN